MTIKDVAHRAGVSVATVSRVLNEDPKVKPHYRTRVLEAIADLNYRPNRLAANLRTQRTRVIGLIIPDIRNPFFMDVVRGIEDRAWSSGYTVVLCNSDDDPDRERAYLDVAREERWAGVILLAYGLEAEEYNSLGDSGIPLVLLDRRWPGVVADTVLSDNVGGTRLAIQHLLGLGHRRIGFIAGPKHFTPGAERLRGYLEALAEAGVPVEPGLIVDGGFTEDGGREVCLALLDLANPPSAIFCSNNLMTLGALAALKQRGVSIPQGMAVVGFDDLPWAELLSPPMTSVAQPAYEIGTQAMGLLLERTSGQVPERPTREVIMAPVLKVRGSCGARP